MILRRNAKSLNVAEKKAFTDAVLSLKRKTGTLHSEKIQSRYDDYVEVHLKAMMAMGTPSIPNWGHQASAFGPWHRVLLSHFESDLRLIDSSVSLPYWDWTDQACTDAVFSSDFLGGNGRDQDGQVMDGPFAFASNNWTVVIKDDDTGPDFLYRAFGKGDGAQSLPNAQMQSKTMAMTAYDEAPWYDMQRSRTQMLRDLDAFFRPSLEVDLHNLVHRYIGGNMVWAASPNDPVFFLHHCNLDRLWSLWEQKVGVVLWYAPMHNGPAGQSGDQPLIFHAPPDAGPWLGDSKPEDVYDSRRQIGVGYDTDTIEAATTLLAHSMIAPAMKMQMQPSMMYPLHSEIADEKMKPMRMFPLRAEIERSSGSTP